MSKKLIYSFVLVFVLTGVLGLAFRVQPVEASGTIYIRADGSVEGTTYIVSGNNITFVFTADINDSIVVEKSSTIVDGNGHTLNGSGSLMYGFNLTSVSNVTIKNVNVLEFGYAMWLEGASQCDISNNTCTTNEGGIWLVSSTENTVSGNTIKGSVEAVALDSSSGNNITGNNIMDSYYYGVYVRNNSAGNTISGNNITATINGAGIYLNGSPNNVISGNNIKDSLNEHVCLLHSSNNNRIFGNNLSNSTADVGLYMYACSLNSISRNNITANADTGIRLDMSSDSTISENNISENLNGVYLWYSSNITVSGNDITANNASGVVLDNSDNNVVNGNNIIANNWWGINPAYSNNNTISGNNIRNNNVGINSASSDFNIVSANNIIANGYSGLYLESSSNNTFQHNNLINNTNQVVVELGYANNWDDGFEGNYWSNYTGVDSNRDGIGDSWLQIDENNTDHYPLMGMFSSFNNSLGLYADVISNSTIEDLEYFESNSTIIMHVSNMTINQTHGFCRNRIPHALMNETYHVTIDGAEPYYVNYTLFDDGENRWIYFEYEHSTLEIVIIPEFPLIFILPLFMTASLIVITSLWKEQRLERF